MNRAQHRIARTNQHPSEHGRYEEHVTHGAGGMASGHRAGKYVRNGPIIN